MILTFSCPEEGDLRKDNSGSGSASSFETGSLLKACCMSGVDINKEVAISAIEGPIALETEHLDCI